MNTSDSAKQAIDELNNRPELPIIAPAQTGLILAGLVVVVLIRTKFVCERL